MNASSCPGSNSTGSCSYRLELVPERRPPPLLQSLCPLKCSFWGQLLLNLHGLEVLAVFGTARRTSAAATSILPGAVIALFGAGRALIKSELRKARHMCRDRAIPKSSSLPIAGGPGDTCRS